MEEEREGDPRVPVISCLFFLFVMTGGALLVVYVFVPKLSKPWYPKAALILIGSPWIFWFFTFTYACLKGRCGGGGGGSRVATARPSRRATRKGGAAAAAAANSAAAPPNKESPQPIDGGSGHGQEQEQNGQVEGQGEGRGDSSIASRESEKPLNSSASS